MQITAAGAAAAAAAAGEDHVPRAWGSPDGGQAVAASNGVTSEVGALLASPVVSGEEVPGDGKRDSEASGDAAGGAAGVGSVDRAGDAVKRKVGRVGTAVPHGAAQQIADHLVGSTDASMTATPSQVRLGKQSSHHSHERRQSRNSSGSSSAVPASILSTFPTEFLTGLEPESQAMLLAPPPAGQQRRLHDFLVCLGVCHTVIPEKSHKTGKLVFRASSPDEEALVKAAQCLGYGLVTSAPEVSLRLGEAGKAAAHAGLQGAVHGGARQDAPSPSQSVLERLGFVIIGVNEFNSDRKRMSVVARRRDPRTGQLLPGGVLFCKGADNKMLELITNWTMNGGGTGSRTGQGQGQ